MGKGEFRLSRLFDQKLLRRKADERFAPRPKLNDEQVLILKNSKRFTVEADRISHKYQIPRLDEQTDLIVGDVSIGDKSTEVHESNFLTTKLSIKRHVHFQREVNNLLAALHLPQNFYDWVESYILYRKIPKWIPKYYWELENDFISNPEKTSGLGLSTKEKKLIKQELRKRLGIKSGRPLRAVREVYSFALKILAQSKKKERGYRT